MQIETDFLLCETDVEMVPGPFFCFLVGFFSSLVRFLDIENSSQRRLLLLCQALRRVCFARPGLKRPSLRRLTIVWPRRDVRRRFTWNCFQRSIRAHHNDLHTLVLLLLCVSRTDVATKDVRWVRCSSRSLGPRPRPPTATHNSQAAERRGDCVHASWLYS